MAHFRTRAIRFRSRASSVHDIRLHEVTSSPTGRSAEEDDVKRMRGQEQQPPGLLYVSNGHLFTSVRSQEELQRFFRYSQQLGSRGDLGAADRGCNSSPPIRYRHVNNQSVTFTRLLNKSSRFGLFN